jgi:hypothetical protein
MNVTLQCSFTPMDNSDGLIYRVRFFHNQNVMRALTLAANESVAILEEADLPALAYDDTVSFFFLFCYMLFRHGYLIGILQ